MPMRLPIYTVAMPILAAFAFAQDTPPVQPKQPVESGAASKAGSDRPQEVKTQTYAGTLIDASCATRFGNYDASTPPGSLLLRHPPTAPRDPEATRVVLWRPPRRNSP